MTDVQRGDAEWGEQSHSPRRQDSSGVTATEGSPGEGRKEVLVGSDSEARSGWRTLGGLLRAGSRNNPSPSPSSIPRVPLPCTLHLD